jgi:hypothetical protein
MSIYFKNKLKQCTLSTGKRESLMHSHVCSCGELVSQRGNVSESAGCSCLDILLLFFCLIFLCVFKDNRHIQYLANETFSEL